MSSESDATREDGGPDGVVRGAAGDDEVRCDEDAARTDGGSDAGGPNGGSDTYTHVPAGMEDPRGADAPAAQDGLGRRGWILVGVVFLGTIVCPAIVYLYPAVLADHVPFRFAMLVVPFLPAALLGATAVWAMAARRD